jgi:hypothetical protein
MIDESFMPCWKFDLLPEKIAKSYMSVHTRIIQKTTKSKIDFFNFSDQLKQYSLNLVA